MCKLERHLYQVVLISNSVIQITDIQMLVSKTLNNSHKEMSCSEWNAAQGFVFILWFIHTNRYKILQLYISGSSKSCKSSLHGFKLCCENLPQYQIVNVTRWHFFPCRQMLISSHCSVTHFSDWILFLFTYFMILRNFF